jgi:uncharacterized protein YuzE
MVYLTDKETHKTMVKETQEAIAKAKAKEALEKKREIFKNKIAGNKPIINYYKDEDVMGIFFGPKVSDNSRELKNVNVLVDFDKRGNIVGLEIDGFWTAFKESQKEIEEIFKLSDKPRKKKKKV